MNRFGFLLLVSGVAGFASAQYFSTDNFIPSPRYTANDGTIFPTTNVMWTGIRLDVSNGRIAPPSGGGPVFTSFFDVFVELDLTIGGTPSTYNAQADGTVSIQDIGGGNYMTEMTQLDIAGGNLPGGMMFRESPTMISMGQTTISPTTGGYEITSFFDIFTELSLDGGATWIPSSGHNHLEGTTPEPASILALAGLSLGLLKRRNRVQK